MTPILGGFAAFREPVARTVFAPGFDLWQRLSDTLRRFSRIVLPERSREPQADELPAEYFRFPPF